jgi:hypothetical protein
MRSVVERKDMLGSGLIDRQSQNMAIAARAGWKAFQSLS